MQQILKHEMYLAFMRFRATFLQYEKFQVTDKGEEYNFERPNDTTECSTETLNSPELEKSTIFHINYGLCDVNKVEQEIVCNYFSPSIYKNLFSKNDSLKLIRSNFLNNHGEKLDNYTDNAQFVFTIIKKREILDNDMLENLKKMQISDTNADEKKPEN